MPFTTKDLLRDGEGDLVLDSNGDLKLASEKETLEGDILFRVRTDHFDYGPAPFLGADLRSVLGEPNTERTGDLIKEKVHVALTQDGRVPAGVLYIDVIPLDVNSVQLFVIVSDRIGNETTSSVVTKAIDLEPLPGDQESILNTAE